jgi:hypothetical protein
MAGNKLDLLVLKDWSQNASYRLARRAWLISEFLEGQDTKSLSTSVAMTEQRVEEVIQRYKGYGLIGLFEASRSGRPSSADSISIVELVGKMKKLEEDQIASKIAAYKKISEHTIWRTARIESTLINRSKVRAPLIRSKISASIPLIASVFSKEFQLLVIGPGHKSLLELEPSGKLDAPSKPLVLAAAEVLVEKNIVYLEDMISISKELVTDVPNRVAQERRIRLVNNLDRIETIAGFPIRIYLSGDIRSKAFADWIKALKRSKFCADDPKSKFRFFPDLNTLLSELLPSAQSKTEDRSWSTDMSAVVLAMREEIVWYRFPET